jgi:hypothetical protein
MAFGKLRFFFDKNEKKFHLYMTIHTPIESHYRVYAKHVILKIFIPQSGSKNDQK